jgi:hypothetical protein
VLLFGDIIPEVLASPRLLPMEESARNLENKGKKISIVGDSG